VTEEPPVLRSSLREALERLEREDSRGILVLGDPGTGKSTLLRMLSQTMRQQGRSAFYVPLSNVGRPGQVAGRILQTVASASPGLLAGSRMLQSSAGVPPMSEVLDELRRAGDQLTRPALILDGLDESADPAGTVSTVAEVSRALTGWQLVIGSRPTGLEARFEGFAGVHLGPLSFDQMLTELGISARVGPQQAYTQRNVELFVQGLIDGTPDPALAAALLERLALLGGRDTVAALAAWSGRAADIVAGLCDKVLTTVDGDTVALTYDGFRAAILAARLRSASFRLADLRFGAEDAEHDDLLDDSFVLQHSLGTIHEQRRSIVVGDRGSGKSAIFRKLSTAPDGLDILPVANTGDLLQRIAGPAAHDADTLRAAWLVVVAAVVAAVVPESAPTKLRREAAELRAVVGLPTRPAGRWGRVLRAAARPFGGTTLRFAVGPVNLEAQLPDGGRPSTATVDVESFLLEVDRLVAGSGRRVVVMFDRIDELFKYDRGRQEAVVQGLFQVESRISLLSAIRLVVFLRTDLFELYDIQEKNKLVSRRLVLEWTEQDWLRVLVLRLVANKSLGWVADRLRQPGGGIEAPAALGVLLPAEVEGRPIDRWLVDSVRNGNGDVSPRLAILLLYLARDYSPRQTDPVDALPLFPADAVARAMTEVSELSFSEVVNDFKVAPSFVLNCRAGKRTTFALAEVENLFEPDDGPISEQVRLLERLGFLERVVVETGGGAQSRFRIPALYTRCWEHG
jgi:energy-coupling factor transporter ATP-binding protein EcfA2